MIKYDLRGSCTNLNKMVFQENSLISSPTFLNCTKQRVVLNGKYSSWGSISAEVPKGSTIGPLLILICINDLSHDLPINVKLLADGFTLSSVLHKMNISAINLNNDVKQNQTLSNSMENEFWPHPQEVIFSRKVQKTNHNSFYFNF